MMLDDQVAIVTGASRGIGRAIAMTFAAQGAKLAICSRSEQLELVASDIRNAGGQVISVRGDIADDLVARELVKQCRMEFGRADILVNNAAIITQALLGMTTGKAIQEMLAVNIGSMINLTQYVIRLMHANRSPSIVNLASIAGTRGLEGVTAYSASKGAVVAFTLASAKELAPRGIRVNAIAPGFIDTDMTRNLPADWYQRRLASIGMGRAGTAEDVASAALFLASSLSRYITGQVLGVDGGMVA
jgi:3-oxoacyl-[acyl-carrier protein] reductase